jgi:hypothetical protein
MSENDVAAWTFMVYFAANNDLQDEAFNNLSQMIQIGGTDNVHVVAQVHARDPKAPTRRYFMRSKNNAEVEALPGVTNTGNVKDLVDFVSWSRNNHEAQNYLLVLWGHTNGIFDDEDDIGTLKLQDSLEGVASRDAKLGVNVDVALTSLELKAAFNQIEEVLGKKVDILGLDSCLMSMAEIAHQISGSVELMVASEEVVPNTSWPYDRILQKLTSAKNQPVPAEELAKTIVDQYVEAYESTDRPVTLSACRLKKSPDLAAALNELGSALSDLMKNEQLISAVSKARRDTLMFEFREYVDLYDFCEKLLKTLNDDRFRVPSVEAAVMVQKARNACERVTNVIGFPPREDSYVVASKNTSEEDGRLWDSHGVSIYFPPLPTTYGELDLSKQTNWDNFLHGYMNAVFRRTEVDQASGQRPSAAVRTKVTGAGQSSIAKAIWAAAQQAPSETNGSPVSVGNKKPRLLLPALTRIEDRLSGVDDYLKDQAFLIIEESAEIRVPDGTRLNVPRKGTIAVKASTGTRTKVSTGTSTKVQVGNDHNTVSSWLDVPACTLSMPFSGGHSLELKNGTRITPPANGEPIVVINEVNFKAEAQKSEGLSKAAGAS